MSLGIILGCVALYFGILLLISFISTRTANSESYFDGNKQSPWYVVAFGMLGDSLSGVTFISVPGAILLAKFGYLQLVLGYFFGYLIILNVLLPLYYRLNLTSIYSYLNIRFGHHTQHIGAFFFLLSRLLGSAARLYLAATVFQVFIFDQFGVPFWASVSIVIFLIWIYTVKGGIKTLVWTDTFQSFMLILGVVLSIWAITHRLGLSFSDLPNIIINSPYSTFLNWDWMSKNNFFKQFLSGVFIAVAMTGLDQNMMQKNLSIKTLKDSQTNMFWFSVIMVITNIIFLSLGVFLYYYAEKLQIMLPMQPNGAVFTDRVFPTLALEHLGIGAGIAFIVGLTAATFSSADSVLTTLTTSYYIDLLHLSPSENSKKLRHWIHLLFALILLVLILIIQAVNQSAIIDVVLKVAGYTYGPILGIFFLGIFTKFIFSDRRIAIICIVSPFIAYLIDNYSNTIYFNLKNQLPLWNTLDPSIASNMFQLGNTVLIINALITILAALCIGRKK